MTSPVSQVAITVQGIIKPVTPTPETPVLVAGINTSKQKVYFKLASTVLTPASKSALKKLVRRAVRAGSSFKVSTVGFTQPTRVDPNFEKLSLDRAKVAARFLRSLGVKGVYFVKGAGQAPRNVVKPRYAQVTIKVRTNDL